MIFISKGDTMRSKVCLKPIPIEVFLSHVEALRTGDGFQREFQALLDWETKRWDGIKEIVHREQMGKVEFIACEYWEIQNMLT